MKKPISTTRTVAWIHPREISSSRRSARSTLPPLLRRREPGSAWIVPDRKGFFPEIRGKDMDLPTDPDDLLAQPIGARLLRAVAELRRPATTQELAALVGRHPNSVRVQLGRLAEARLLECRRVPQARGRPRQEWAIAPGARPAGRRPQAY